MKSSCAMQGKSTYRTSQGDESTTLIGNYRTFIIAAVQCQGGNGGRAGEGRVSTGRPCS